MGSTTVTGRPHPQAPSADPSSDLSQRVGSPAPGETTPARRDAALLTSAAEQPSHRRGPKRRYACSEAKASDRFDRFDKQPRARRTLLDASCFPRRELAECSAKNLQSDSKATSGWATATAKSGMSPHNSNAPSSETTFRRARHGRPDRADRGADGRPGSSDSGDASRACGAHPQPSMATSGRLPGDPINAPGYAAPRRRREPSHHRGAPALSGG
jgi:hypothetical protein